MIYILLRTGRLHILQLSQLKNVRCKTIYNLGSLKTKKKLCNLDLILQQFFLRSFYYALKFPYANQLQIKFTYIRKSHPNLVCKLPFSLSIFPLCFYLFPFNAMLCMRNIYCSYVQVGKEWKNVFSHNPFFSLLFVIACWSGRGINNLIKNSQNYSRNFRFLFFGNLHIMWRSWQMYGIYMV